jgi:ribosome biogenesis GTPase
VVPGSRPAFPSGQATHEKVKNLKHFSKRKQKALRKHFEEKAERASARALSHRSVGPANKRESVVRLLAPNLDQLIIVASFGVPAFKAGIVDRLLVLASLENVPALLVINKADLGDRAEVEAAARLYRGLGTDALVTSVMTGEGVDFLRSRLKGQITGVCGHSGVGKSSLLLAVDPSLKGVKTGEVSDVIKKGKHTSTEVRSLPLSDGGRVFDLPGLKLAPVRGVPRTELADHFPEFLAGARVCRFHDCVHDREPDCGVKQQVEEGLVSESRYRSYMKLLGEL